MARTRQKRLKTNLVLNSELNDNELSEDLSEDNDTDDHIDYINDLTLNQMDDNNTNIQQNIASKEVSNQILIKNIIFVENESKDMSLMRNAFHSIKSNKVNKKWTNFNELTTFESFDNHLFVINSFDGQIFESLLERNARIISPLVILYSYSSDSQMRFDSIPLKSYPIMSQCMRHLKVSITNFNEEKRRDLINKIKQMLAHFSKDLTSDVTHLVSDSVVTQKYKVASSIGKTVVTSEWVDFCWERHQYLLCHANDQQIINRFRTPIFKNLMICVSQVSH
jgi:hypothetical protein